MSADNYNANPTSQVRDDARTLTKYTLFSREQAEHLLAATLLGVFLIIFYRDVVFGGRTFLQLPYSAGTMPMSAGASAYNYPGDLAELDGMLADPAAIAWANEPSIRTAQHILASGEIPLWNSHVGLGEPLLADGNSAPLEPLQLLSYLVPVTHWPVAQDGVVLLRFFLAGFFTYLFARRLGLSLLPALFAGAAFMLNSYFVAYGNHPQLRANALLPLALYSFDRLKERRSYGNVVLAAAVTAWILLASFPEAGFIVLTLASSWYVYRSALAFWTSRDVRSALLRPAAGFLAALMIGVALSSIVLIPLLQNIRGTLHIHEAGAGLIFSPPAMAVLSLLPRVMPNLPMPEINWSPHFYAAVWVLGILGVLTKWRPREHAGALWFFAVYGIVFYLKIYGFPLVQWIGLLPGFTQMTMTKYPVLLISMCFSLCAAFGVEAALQARIGIHKVLAVFVAVFAVLSAIVFLHQPLNIDTARLLPKAFFVLTIVLVICLLVVALYIVQPWRNELAALLVVIIVVEPVCWHNWMVRPVRYDPYTPPPFTQFLQHQPGVHRIFGFDRVLQPNVASVYGIDDVRFVTALIPKYRALYQAQFLTPAALAPELLLQPGESASTAALARLGKLLSIAPDKKTPAEAQVANQIAQLMGVEYPLYTGQYFDVLNTEYLVTIPDLPPLTSLNLLAIANNGATQQPGPQVGQAINLTGELTNGFVQQAPARRDIPLLMPSGKWSLHFHIAGSGMDFAVKVIDGAGEHVVFMQTLDASASTGARGWQTAVVDLAQWSGQRVTIVLENTPGTSGSDPTAYWTSPILTLQETPPRWATEALTSLNRIHINTDLLDQNLEKRGDTFAIKALTIGDKRLPALFMHAPNSANLMVNVPINGAKLQFSVGMDPNVWQTDNPSDGASFQVDVQASTGTTTVYSQTINPRLNEQQRAWLPVQIDLNSWRGKQVTLRFATTGGSSHVTDGDWAYWGDIYLTGEGIASANPTLAHFEQVYDGEVQIYRNMFTSPRAFVVHNVIAAATSDAAVKQLVQADFDLSTSAVITTDSADMILPTGSADVTAQENTEVVARTANTITVNASLDKPGLLVLSEAYSPGWHAYVDSRQVPIYPVNVFMRGVSLNGGTHTVEFVYAPLSFTVGAIISLSALFGVFIVYLVLIFMKRRTS